MSKVQVCASIPIELNDEIIKISQKESRTISQTITILLTKAVREKTRIRGKKQVRITDNTSN